MYCVKELNEPDRGCRRESPLKLNHCIQSFTFKLSLLSSCPPALLSVTTPHVNRDTAPPPSLQPPTVLFFCLIAKAWVIETFSLCWTNDPSCSGHQGCEYGQAGRQAGRVLSTALFRARGEMRVGGQEPAKRATLIHCFLLKDFFQPLEKKYIYTYILNIWEIFIFFFFQNIFFTKKIAVGDALQWTGLPSSVYSHLTQVLQADSIQHHLDQGLLKMNKLILKRKVLFSSALASLHYNPAICVNDAKLFQL